MGAATITRIPTEAPKIRDKTKSREAFVKRKVKSFFVAAIIEPTIGNAPIQESSSIVTIACMISALSSVDK